MKNRSHKLKIYLKETTLTKYNIVFEIQIQVLFWFKELEVMHITS